MTMRRVVFVSYNGLLDPLGPSQIVPYLEGLSEDYGIHILSFERSSRLQDTAVVLRMEQRLATAGIRWTSLLYHKWPSLLATTWDTIEGARALNSIVQREASRFVHARGYLPAQIALWGAPRLPLLFDIRGLQPEEYVEGGIWKKGELKWRLAKRAEGRFLEHSSAAVVLTDAIRPYVESRFKDIGRAPPIETIPCCVDPRRFRRQPSARAVRRASLGVATDTVVLVYSGSLGTWYMPREMAEFARAFRDTTARPVHLLWLVNNDHELAEQSSEAAGFQRTEWSVRSASADEIPEWLSAADAGLALIRPTFSKRSSSPTKYAEYLAAGLPVVLCREVGDGSALIDAGVATEVNFPSSDEQMRVSARKLERMLELGTEFVTAIAERFFDIRAVALPAYRRLYEALSR